MTSPTTSGAVPSPRASTAAPAGTVHEVSVVDGRFAHAECTCGWRTAGRRDRRALRREARDHALLYADASQLGRQHH